MMKILKIGTIEFKNYINKIVNRSAINYNLEKKVCKIIGDVRRNGDIAILKYTRLFDCSSIKLENLKVKKSEILDSYDYVNSQDLSAIEKLIDRITKFEKELMPKSWMKEKKNIILGQYIIPLEKVGIYVPGGAKSYPSSFLFCTVPAKLAGVKRIVVVSPPDKNGKLSPYLLVAANKLGIDEIYKIGGAQAVAALAYGTKTVPRVDKIVGPGNIYVTIAKKIVFGEVDIDFLAGPTEILILANNYGNPKFIASDLLSQAEHAGDALAICITTSLKLAKGILKELNKQMQDLSRKEIIKLSLKRSAIILVKNIDEGISLANEISPEHLEIFTKSPFSLLNKIRNAGAIFLGPYSPVSGGDYIAGPSHVLPTGGSARFFSPLSIRNFIKTSNVISFTKKGLEDIGRKAMRIAEIEGLDAHTKSIGIRLGKEQNYEKKSENR